MGDTPNTRRRVPLMNVGQHQSSGRWVVTVAGRDAVLMSFSDKVQAEMGAALLGQAISAAVQSLKQTFPDAKLGSEDLELRPAGSNRQQA